MKPAAAAFLATLALSMALPMGVSTASAEVVPCTPSAVVLSTETLSERTSGALVRKRVEVQGKKASRKTRVRVFVTWSGATNRLLRAAVRVTACRNSAAMRTQETVRFRVQASSQVTKQATRTGIKAKATKAATRAAMSQGTKATSTKNRRAINAKVPAAADKAAHRLVVSPGGQVSRESRQLIRRAVAQAFNSERTDRGLPALSYLPQADAKADRWAEIVKAGPFEHDPELQQQFDALGCNAPDSGWSSHAAENLHWGAMGTATQIARDAVEGWLNSPGHRAMMLDPGLRWLSIGLSYNPDGDYWTVAARTTDADCSNLHSRSASATQTETPRALPQP